MAEKFKLPVILIIFAAISIALFLFIKNAIVVNEYGGVSAENNIAPPKKELFYADLTIDHMRLNNDEAVYSLKGGDFYRNGIKLSDAEKDISTRLLRLALFYQWFVEDPFVSGSTLNTAGFENDLKVAERENKIMAAKLDNKTIYPENFLKAYLESTKSYNNFMNDISEKAAQKLIIDSDKTILAYKTDAVEKMNYIKQYINARSSDYSIKKIAYLGGETTTSMDLILQDIKTILNNGEALQTEAGSRKKCFTESEFYCERPALRSQKPQKITETENSPPQLLSEKYLALDKSRSSYWTLRNYRGPYKIHSPCWNKKNTQYIYISKLDYEGLRLQLEYLGDKMYFVKPGIVASFDKRLKALGVGAMIQPATTSYTCPDLAYKPKLAVLDGFYTKYGENRLFSENMITAKSNKIADIIKEGKSAEEEFFGAKYPSENDLDYLGNYYGYAWAYFRKNYISFDGSDELLKRYLLIKEKMYNFDLILARSLFDYEYFNGMLTTDNISLDFGFIYPTKGNYSLLFLDFSGFIWKIPQKPEYIFRIDPNKSELMPTFDAFMDYKKAIAEFGMEKLLKWSRITTGTKRY